MEEIKEGEYVRTENGFIGKIENINDFRPPESKYAVDIQAEDLVFIGEDFIKKHSPNIIDLIEEGDYINGCLVTAIYDEYKNDNTIQFETNYEGRYRYYTDEEIKSIVTHEQFNQVKYEVQI